MEWHSPKWMFNWHRLGRITSYTEVNERAFTFRFDDHRPETSDSYHARGRCTIAAYVRFENEFITQLG